MTSDPDITEVNDDPNTIISAILFELESVITDLDQDAKGAGFVLNDSNVRSAVIKVIRKTEGNPGKPGPAPKEASKDFWIAKLQTRLQERLLAMADKSAKDMGGEPMTFPEWRPFLLVLKETVEERSSREPGSREFLNHIEDFVRGGREKGIGSLLDVKLKED